jgi:hypothetical protein
VLYFADEAMWAPGVWGEHPGPGFSMAFDDLLHCYTIGMKEANAIIALTEDMYEQKERQRRILGPGGG